MIDFCKFSPNLSTLLQLRFGMRGVCQLLLHATVTITTITTKNGEVALSLRPLRMAFGKRLLWNIFLMPLMSPGRHCAPFCFLSFLWFRFLRCYSNSRSIQINLQTNTLTWIRYIFGPINRTHSYRLSWQTSNSNLAQLLNISSFFLGGGGKLFF